jgi:hypothetical protein
VSASVFGSAHSFLHSTLWTLIEIGFGVFVGLFFLASVYWVYKDARRRIAEPALVAASTVLGALPPFLGPLIYMLFRPPEYLEDVRERELEIQAIESRLGTPSQRCGVCGSGVDDDFLVCPVCTTQLRQACASCSRPLEAAWQVCPYCATAVVVEAPVALAQSPRAPRSTRSSSPR